MTEKEYLEKNSTYPTLVTNLKIEQLELALQSINYVIDAQQDMNHDIPREVWDTKHAFVNTINRLTGKVV